MRYIYFLLLIGLLSCGTEEYVPNFEIDSVEGLKPIYADSSELKIALEDPRAIERAGKIYSYGNLLIVNEVGKGFHILDNSDPRNPQNLYFVLVPGNNDVAIKSGIIYADNFSDLVALEVSADTVVVLKRIKNLIGSSGDYPSQRNVYFECVDNSKGIVVGWESVMLDKPQCYRQ